MKTPMHLLERAADMATKPDLVAPTQLDKETATDVKVVVKRRVTYIFIAKSSENLSIPYAVSINGAVPAKYQGKPERVSGANGEILIENLNEGDKVTLYLNSDAHPSYRTAPVYEVTVQDKDIQVTVTEKSGKHSDSDQPTQVKDKDAAIEAKKTVDTYTAPLTGDIWMKVSHKYTNAEVDALVPADTLPEVIAAVKSIYAVLSKAELKMSLPAKGADEARTLTVAFEDSQNPRANITAYTLLVDGLTRVHPGGYAALFNAALENNIPSLTLTSCWRPMLGSIAHRAGLGLDVNMVGGTRMNREELRNSFLPSTKTGKDGKEVTTPAANAGNNDDKDNVTDNEVTLFKEYEDAIVARKDADAEVKDATAALNKKGLSADEKVKAAARLKEATSAQKNAAEADDSAREAWNEERNANEPDNIKLYRASLLKCSCVKQLFDPWFLDGDTQDKVDPEANMQRGAGTSNERLHAHHLHVTVFDPKIL
jgi:hypothetical protein